MTDTPTDADAFTTVVVKETKIGSVLLKNAILLVRFDRRAIKNGAFNRTIPVTVRSVYPIGATETFSDGLNASTKAFLLLLEKMRSADFKLGTTAKEADEKINAAFGQGCSTIPAYRIVMLMRTSSVVEEDPHKGTREIAKVLGVSHNTAMEEHEGRGRHSDVDEDKLRDVVEEDTGR
ncbi:unnamed protein product [Heligmosomoides polygyrus]|uniref:Thioredoxin-like protein n=1 Tax=Heligmosomoides polygyrus TaxID=6339 RepID=A0A183GMA5_HELPZ|nr:unnamed protein product [Heligmosomoides polygyrus]